MSSTSRVEIDCPACGVESLLIRKPIYQGFAKSGETLHCAACGHTFASETEIPFKHKPKLNVFSDDDRPVPVKVFEGDEHKRLCRYCANYVINPFTQWCSLHRKEVESIGTCPQFQAGKEDSGPDLALPPQ